MTDANRKIELHEVVCTACGCACDDLSIVLSADRVQEVAPRCPLAEQHFTQAVPADAACRIQGESASFDEATARAAELLAEAQAPLVMGLQRASIDAVRIAIAIADRVRGHIDPTDDGGRSQNHVAVQTVGLVSATLGEAANRADLVVYWGVDPAETHPRHQERFAAKAGHVVVVDREATATARAADQFIQIDANRQFEALCILRDQVRRLADASPPPTYPPNPSPSRQIGEGLAGLEPLADLARRLAEAKYAALFYELAAEDPSGPAAVSQAIAELVRDLHASTRAVALRLGRPGNAVGAAQALTWQTGYPSAVSFRRGYPEYSPGEGCAERLLASGEVDAALIVGADPLESYRGAAHDRLASVPTIVLDGAQSSTMRAAQVAIATAPFGVSEAGEIYRSDGVALPLTPVIPSTAPSSAEALDAIRNALTLNATN